ncbi:hypothetical protein BGZ61DRAFT_524705 [Ilyonectria robusta]|uniref:uncharacterized protein n=1 Tax=Ilyonectria robusta TaxID=1079257 RepID=UPI001E8CE395|nr:uncharacterized protein BGZ61DRAFT_524705 [Ilyonectria robusta]KAH8649602.1 hypothetical protein BGZ61DRAFT_524705 [Ilyonectria robusta]
MPDLGGTSCSSSAVELFTRRKLMVNYLTPRSYPEERRRETRGKKPLGWRMGTYRIFGMGQVRGLCVAHALAICSSANKEATALQHHARRTQLAWRNQVSLLLWPAPCGIEPHLAAVAAAKGHNGLIWPQMAPMAANGRKWPRWPHVAVMSPGDGAQTRQVGTFKGRRVRKIPSSNGGHFRFPSSLTQRDRSSPHPTTLLTTPHDMADDSINLYQSEPFGEALSPQGDTDHRLLFLRHASNGSKVPAFDLSILLHLGSGPRRYETTLGSHCLSTQYLTADGTFVWTHYIPDLIKRTCRRSKHGPRTTQKANGYAQNRHGSGLIIIPWYVSLSGLQGLDDAHRSSAGKDSRNPQLDYML